MAAAGGHSKNIANRSKKKMKKDCNRYERVPISDKTADGMTMNINDLKYLQRMFLLQDDAFEHLMEIQEEKIAARVSEMVAEKNATVIIFLEKINSRLDVIERRLDRDSARLDRLERYIRIENVLIRFAIAVGLATLLSTFVIKFI